MTFLIVICVGTLSRHLYFRILITLLVLDYLFSIIFNDLTNELNTKLQKSFNAVRFVYGLRYDEHITPYRMWLSVRHRHLLQVGCLLYLILQKQTPSYLFDFFATPLSSARATRVFVLKLVFQYAVLKYTRSPLVLLRPIFGILLLEQSLIPPP